jgi:hypothetical protein
VVFPKEGEKRAGHAPGGQCGGDVLATQETIQEGGARLEGEGKTSQSNEDEIIRAIFDEIGEGDRRFVEFGSGDGRQNNTIALLKRGWSGVWLDPHKKRIASAKERWGDYPVQIIRRMVTPENVYRIVGPIDFLSIDIDGMDYEVWRAMDVRPRVVCIEYCLHDNIEICNKERLEWFTALAESKGYKFVTNSKSGVNAFYIHES